MDKLLKEVGNRIREYRKSRGWTQEQLAEYADLSVNYLATMEIGRKTPSLRTLARLAEALGVDICDLLVKEKTREELDSIQYISRSLSSLGDSDTEFAKALLRFVVEYLKREQKRG